MKKLSTFLLTLVFLFASVNLPVFAVIPGEDAAPAASSLTYGELQEMYFEYLFEQQIPLTVGTPEYYQYAQAQIYDDTDPTLEAHPLYSQIRAYLIEYSALYQDYLYGISALQQNTSIGERLIAQFSVDNPCLQYNAVSKELTFSLSNAFLNKTLAQSKAENEAQLAAADQIAMQNAAATAAVNYTYSPTAAIQYARQYARSANSDYPDYRNEFDLPSEGDWNFTDSVDCTNFASQCLFAGGIPMVGSNTTSSTHETSNQWYCIRTSPILPLFAKTTSWIRASDFSIHMRGRAVQWRIVGTLDELVAQCQPGDIVQLMEKNGGRIHHSTIISKKDSSTAYYCAHSTERLDEDVRDYFNETTDSFVILSFRKLPSVGGVSLDTCEPCDDQVPSTTSIEFQGASLDRVVECPNHNGTHDAEKYVYTYNITCTRHGTVVGTKYETVYICVTE